MKKYLISTLPVLFVFLFASTLFAQIVTDDPQEQAALEALLKDAELSWDDIDFTENIMTNGEKNGHTLVYIKNNKSDSWTINRMARNNIYLNDKGKIIAIKLYDIKIPNLSRINQLKSLIFFSCNSCYIDKFDHVQDLPELEELQIPYTGIEEIGQLKNLPKLKFLDLSRNGIKKIQNLNNIPSL